ncbi:MmgE/PrpD family protein [Aeromicrobium sp. CF3.5]|uniref:MmgE/PrpD family protein n=1 Tax=Aeromicrobium sp. CF3.5 TaxID=3373078 RepID=UPI003EE43849
MNTTDASTMFGDDALRRKVSLVLADDLAAMIAGHEHAEVRTLVTQAKAHGGQQEARLLNGVRLPREKAAAINATAAAWDELDEGYRPATCHGGLYTIPVVIAEAEATGRTIAEVLAAVVVGYEVVTAFARVLPAPRPLVLHPHATLSPIGAAAALTWLRTGDARSTLAAADVAVTMSMAGPFEHAVSGAQVRNAWPAAGAMLGFLAADMAAAGLGAEPTSARETFARGYGHSLNDAELDHDFAYWAILDGYHKAYATCQYTHSALEASVELADGALAGRSIDDIRDIMISTHPLAYPLDNRSPLTTLAGKFSLPHVVSAVLATGQTEPSTFDEHLLADEAIDRLRQRVQISPFEPLPPAPHDRPARVTLTFTDGSVADATCLSAIGGPDRPLTESHVLDKIARLTEPAAPAFESFARSLVDGPMVDQRAWSLAMDGALG